MTDYQLSTQAVHAGEERRKPYGAVTTPIVQTSTYTFQDTGEILDFMRRKAGGATSVRDEYGRYSNPTQTAAERKLASLEGGEQALLFASGMSAITTTLAALLSAGDHLVLVSDCYHRTREFALSFLGRWGIETTLVCPGQPGVFEEAVRPNTRLIFGETPTNPYLRVLDLAEMVRVARPRGILTMVDSTFATPVNLRPLSMGIDLVVHSATKYLAGHNDLLAGVVIGARRLLAPVEHARGVMGGVSNANDAYLLIRGLKTLELRIGRQNENGMRVAQFLEAQPAVRRVHYPGLPSHPDHGLARELLTGYGGVVSFEIDGAFEETGRFVDLLRLPYIGPTLGGVESIVEQPAALFSLDPAERNEAGLVDNLVRYALGIENAEDLIADLHQALTQLQVGEASR
ncbi:MAG: aminotransferase class I/II-fold pyridoxal phosphate-dependent enzyme [Anaerolineae bacterium]|nr:aminotransferase class I/II-fold pyridoxal phosphate-dependent enzyme [Anaerolineae bacterium]